MNHLSHVLTVIRSFCALLALLSSDRYLVLLAYLTLRGAGGVSPRRRRRSCLLSTNGVTEIGLEVGKQILHLVGDPLLQILLSGFDVCPQLLHNDGNRTEIIGHGADTGRQSVHICREPIHVCRQPAYILMDPIHI